MAAKIGSALELDNEFSPGAALTEVIQNTREKDNREIYEQEAVLCTEAAVMNGMNPIGFAVILDRISVLLENGTRKEQPASVPIYIPPPAVETEDEVNDDDEEKEKEYLSSVEFDWENPKPEQLRYSIRSEEWSPTFTVNESDSISKSSIDLLENKYVEQRDRGEKFEDLLLLQEILTDSISKSNIGILEKRDAKQRDRVEEFEALRYLQEIVTADKKSSGQNGLGNTGSLKQKSRLRRTVLTWDKQKQEDPLGSKSDAKRFMSKAFRGKGKKAALLAEKSEAEFKDAYRRRDPIAHVSEIDELDNEESVESE